MFDNLRLVAVRFIEAEHNKGKGLRAKGEDPFFALCPLPLALCFAMLRENIREFGVESNL